MLKRLLLLLGLVLLAGVGLAAGTSRTTSTVPAWGIHITDSSGQPVARACVSETWQQYSFEEEEHSVEVRADSAGNVSFPERRVTASALRRFVGPLSHALSVHAGHGAYAFLVVWAPGLTGSTMYKEGDSLPRTLVLDRDASGWHERPDGRCSPPDLQDSSAHKRPNER